MRIKSVQINNYKSMGDTDNTLRFDSDIITLIGKNETGKSNILLALAGLKFFKPVSKTVFADCNKFLLEKKVSAQIEVEIVNADLMSIGKRWHTDKSTVTFFFSEDDSDTFSMRFDGCLRGIMEEDPEFSLLQSDTVTVIEQFLKQYPTDQNMQNLLSVVRHSQQMFVPLPEYVNSFRQGHLNSDQQKSNRQIFDSFWQVRQKHYDLFSQILPVILNFDNTLLRDVYSYDELKAKEALMKDTALSRYLDAIGTDAKEFLKANEHLPHTEHHSLRNKINKRNEQLAKRFNEFYKTEQIGFRLEFDSKRYIFLFTSGEASESFLFSERSTGLRWFFSCFMELERSGASKRALLLIDEPACHLHVNAQKKVLELFKVLASDGRQIIYTTHSPYMIDPNALSEIKVVTKKQYITHVFDLHKARFEGESEMETLTPLARALDCDFCHNIGPSFKKTNLIVEGITDYYYLMGMFDVLHISDEDRPYVIPSCGADNISRLVSIMIGWGCDFKVLYDSDSKGQEAAEKLRQLLVDPNDFTAKVFHVAQDADKTIEDLLSDADRKRLRGSGKELKAKFFLEQIKQGGFAPDTVTCENFRQLLTRTGIRT